LENRIINFEVKGDDRGMLVVIKNMARDIPKLQQKNKDMFYKKLVWDCEMIAIKMCKF